MKATLDDYKHWVPGTVLILRDGRSLNARPGAKAIIYQGVYRSEYFPYDPMIKVRWDRRDPNVGNQQDGGYYCHSFRMEPNFDLKKPAITRSGLKVRDLIKRRSERPLHALIQFPDGERWMTYQANGLFYKDFECPIDLVNI